MSALSCTRKILFKILLYIYDEGFVTEKWLTAFKNWLFSQKHSFLKFDSGWSDTFLFLQI